MRVREISFILMDQIEGHIFFSREVKTMIRRKEHIGHGNTLSTLVHIKYKLIVSGF